MGAAASLGSSGCASSSTERCSTARATGRGVRRGLRAHGRAPTRAAARDGRPHRPRDRTRDARAERVENGEQVWPRFAGALAAALAERAAAMRADGRAFPGAREALATLAQMDGVVQSVLTGNLQPNAATKLGAFGLERHLDLAIGAYGSDDRRRAALVAVARSRFAAVHGAEPEETVLVGDTPLDV